MNNTNNRQIKFRVWCILNGIGRFYSLALEEQGSFNFEILDEKPVFQQFTGLKDRRGKEIYEGDIIRVESGLIEVIYSEDIAGFEGVGLPHKVSSRSLYGYNYPPRSDKVFSVVGNIFENPKMADRARKGPTR